jgi:hypothetical protein
MSDKLHFFETNVRRCVVRLPFEHRVVLDGWQQLRKSMIRECPAPYTRDEWAYLLGFLAADNLSLPFVQAFGNSVDAPTGPIDALFRPRGPVAVWLPSNVSLLGPLVLVLVSLTGNRARLKASSKSDDLTETLLDFAKTRLPPGPLLDYLTNAVVLERFDRDDPRNEAMAAESAVRVFFGSDEGAAAVESLPHPVESVGFPFVDHQSECWMEPACATDENLTTLLKVFTIYGQAGCTSPRRLVVLGGSTEDCLRIRDRLMALWLQVARQDPPMHIASANIMSRQLAAATGWDAELVDRHRGVVAVGDIRTAMTPNLMTLSIVAATTDETIAQLPANIQTVGHCLLNSRDPRWLRCIAASKIKRFVPLAQMHYFGATWDGWSFWQQMFEEVVVAS